MDESEFFRQEQRTSISEQTSSTLCWLPSDPVDHSPVGWGGVINWTIFTSPNDNHPGRDWWDRNDRVLDRRSSQVTQLLARHKQSVHPRWPKVKKLWQKHLVLLTKSIFSAKAPPHSQCVLCQVRCHCIFYGPGIRYSDIFCVPCIW